jgi:acetyl-CoA synthetase
MTSSANASLTAFLAARDFLLAHREDQPSAAREFHWPVLEDFNWTIDYFDAMARDNDKAALWIVNDNGRSDKCSFRQVSQRSAQVANFLRRLGVRRADRILVVLGNEVELWECMLAAFKLGAVVIPSTTMMTSADLRDRIERGHARHVVASSAVADRFADVPGDYTRICVGDPPTGWRPFTESRKESVDFQPHSSTKATEPLLLYFTSGTTSRPKLVLHTHQSYPVGHLSTMFWLGLQPGDVHLNVSSPGWAKHAWSSLFAPWDAGACVLVHNVARFNAKSLLEVIERCGVTSLCAPPTAWRLIIQEDLASYRGRMRLRDITAAGEPLNPEIIDRVRDAWGVTPRDGFGQTETTAVIGNGPEQPVRAGSMGKPLPGYRVTLLDADGNESHEGEICLALDAGPLGLMSCYEDSPEGTGEATRNRYYHTGDVATRDNDGYFTFVGRKDDVFKSSDYRISPFELESALLEHEAVTEVAVVPSPDPVRLAVPKAFVTLAAGKRAGSDLARDLFAFVKRRLAPYKRVRRIEFVTELPKTISGKIRRVELRKLEAESARRGVRKESEYFEEDFA